MHWPQPRIFEGARSPLLLMRPRRNTDENPDTVDSRSVSGIPRISAADNFPPVTVEVYQVADLVVEPPGMDKSQMLKMMRGQLQQLKVTAEAAEIVDGKMSREETAVIHNLEELVGVIQTATVPYEWDIKDGSGSIVPYRKTRSLIVRQTAQGHG
jgi:hypothetical protein